MDLFGERLIGRLVFINERGSGAYLSVSRLEVWNLIKGFQYLTPVLKRPPQDNKTKKRFTQNAQKYHWRANMNKAMQVWKSEIEISSLPSCLVPSLKRNFGPLWVFNVFRRPAFVIFPSSEITYHWHVMSSMLERWGGTLHYNRQAIHLPLWVIVTKLRADLIKRSCVTQLDSERNAWSGECLCDIFWRKGRFCRVLDGTSCHQGPEGPPGLWGLISGWGHRCTAQLTKVQHQGTNSGVIRERGRKCAKQHEYQYEGSISIQKLFRAVCSK